MNGKWLFQGDFNTITSLISEFECSKVELVIMPIQTRPDFMIYGCYVWGSDKSWDKSIDKVFKDGQNG